MPPLRWRRDGDSPDLSTEVRIPQPESPSPSGRPRPWEREPREASTRTSVGRGARGQEPSCRRSLRFVRPTLDRLTCSQWLLHPLFGSLRRHGSLGPCLLLTVVASTHSIRHRSPIYSLVMYRRPSLNDPSHGNPCLACCTSPSAPRPRWLLTGAALVDAARMPGSIRVHGTAACAAELPAACGRPGTLEVVAAGM